MTLKKAIIISIILHTVFYSVFFIVSSGIQVKFDITKGLSGIAVSFQKSSSVNINFDVRLRKENQDNQIDIIVTDKGFFNLSAAGKNKTTAESKNNHNLKHVVGALCQRANNLSRNSPPEYPYIARKLHYEGKVLLDIEVLSDGRAGSINVKSSSGFEILDKAAVDSASKWIFFQDDELKLDESVFIAQAIEFKIRK